MTHRRTQKRRVQRCQDRTRQGARGWSERQTTRGRDGWACGHCSVAVDRWMALDWIVAGDEEFLSRAKRRAPAAPWSAEAKGNGRRAALTLNRRCVNEW